MVISLQARCRAVGSTRRGCSVPSYIAPLRHWQHRYLRIETALRAGCNALSNYFVLTKALTTHILEGVQGPHSNACWQSKSKAGASPDTGWCQQALGCVPHQSACTAGLCHQGWGRTPTPHAASLQWNNGQRPVCESVRSLPSCWHC